MKESPVLLDGPGLRARIAIRKKLGAGRVEADCGRCSSGLRAVECHVGLRALSLNPGVGKRHLGIASDCAQPALLPVHHHEGLSSALGYPHTKAGQSFVEVGLLALCRGLHLLDLEVR